MQPKQLNQPETLVVDDIRTFLVNDLKGRRTLIGLGLPTRQSPVGAPSAAASGLIVIDLEGGAGLWLKLLQSTDVLRDHRVPTDCRVLADVTDMAMGRRLVSCLICDAARVSQGSKAIARFLHRYWTADLANLFGPVPNPRTVRLWRATRGRMHRRRSVEMVSCRGRPKRRHCFHPTVKAALEHIVTAAVHCGATAAEAHEVLHREMQDVDGVISAPHRIPSLSTVNRRMRAARIRGSGPSDGVGGTASYDYSGSHGASSANADDRSGPPARHRQSFGPPQPPKASNGGKE